MKKKITAWILSFLMAFTLGPSNAAFAAVPETDAMIETDASAESDVKTVAEGITEIDAEVITENLAETITSEGCIDYIETDEDIPILTTDVPVITVEWGTEDDEEDVLKAVGVGDGSDTIGESHDLVLVLDCSGSMSGQPMTEMKKACNNFIDDILDEDPAARIAVVGFDSDVTVNTFSGSYFTSNRSRLRSAISSLSAGGSTAMNAGLTKADELLQLYGTAEHQYIIQMTDGEPNEGSQYSGSGARYAGTSFIDPDGNLFTYTSTSQKGYCSEIYNTFSAIQSSYHVYSMGFFHSLSGTTKQFVATFLNDVQNTYYVEVDDADDIIFSFQGIAADINSEHIKLNMDSVNLTEGDTASLIATLDDYMPVGTAISYGSSDTTVATVDENGKIIAKKAGTCTIMAEAGGYSATCEVTITAKPLLLTYSTYTVYQNENMQDASKDKYELCSDATVIYNGHTYKTDSNGQVKLPDGQSGEFTISKNGYTERTISIADLENGAKIYLQKDSDNPVINSVTFDGSDVLAEDYTMSLMKADATTIAVDVDWGKSSRKSIKLVQEATNVEFETDKNFLSLVLKSKFDITKDIYILVTDQNDHSVKKKLNISSDGNVKGLDGISFSAGGSISLTIPDSVPLIKGQKVKFGLDNLEALPFTVTIENGLVYVTFGVDVANYTKSSSTVTNKTTGNSLTTLKSENKYYFEKLENIKKNGIKKSLNDIKNLKARYKTQMKFPKGSFGFDADFTLMGYAQGYVDSEGGFQWLDGGVIFNPSVGANWSGQFAIGPVPCYWEAQLTGAIEAAINLYKNEAAAFLPEGSVSGTISGSVGAGVGINKVATIGGGATVKAEPSVTFYSDKDNYLKCTFSGSLYFKVKLGIIEYKPETKPISCTIDNSPKAKTRMKASAGADLEEDLSDIYDVSMYKAESLDYILDNDLQSKATGALEELELDSRYAGLSGVIAENSYSTTNPKIVSTGTYTRLAVWLNTETDDVNDVQLYYSYYDGTQWSVPAKISDDGTFDSSPEVCAVNGKAYVIWQNAEHAFDENTLNGDNIAEQLAGHMGITIAEFKTITESFTVSDLSKGSGCLDMQPVIAAEGNAAVAYWVENAENDWFGQNMKNTIYKAEFNGTKWNEADAVVSDVSSVCSIAAGYANSDFCVAYTLDKDNDLTDSSDTDLYLDEKALTENDVMESGPVFDNGALYWYSNGTLMQSTELQKGDGESILSEGTVIPTDTFKVLSNGNNRAILYSQRKDGAASEIYALVQTSGGWSSPIQITNCEQYISSFDAVWLNSGIEILCNMTTVQGLETDAYGNEVIDDSTYGSTSLVRMMYSPPINLTIDGCYYEKEAIGAGCTLPITVEVSNTGLVDFEGVKVEVLDIDGTVVYTTNLRNTVIAGETTDLEFGYIVDKDALGKTYSIRCTPLDDGTHIVNEDSASLELSYEDLELTCVNWGQKDSNEAVILAQIANAGFSPLTNVTARLYKVTAGESTEATDNSKTMVAEIEKGTLEPGMFDTVSFSVANEPDAVYYLEVTPFEEEQNIGNNSEYIYLQSAKESAGRTVTSLKATKNIVEYNVGSTLDLRDLKVLAVYDDGTASDVRSICEIDVSAVNMNVAGTYYINVSYDTVSTTVAIKVKAASGAGGTGTETGGSNVETSKVKVGNTITKSGLIYEVTSIQEGKRTVSVKKAEKSSVTKISIPANIMIDGDKYSVTAIGSNAFKGNKKLKSVSFGNKLTSIGTSAFEKCISLKKVTVPSKVTFIGKKAFSKDTNLTSVTLGKSVKTIGASAFSGDKKLKMITVKSKKLKSVGKNGIKGINSKAVIKVPKTKLRVYKKLFNAKSGFKKTMTISK